MNRNITLLGIIMLLFTSCTNWGAVDKQAPIKYKIVIIDNCEYIMTKSIHHKCSLAHKGNCKNHPVNYIK